MQNTLPPQSTPFVERKDLAIIQNLLSDSACHLLTLTGLGGSGKTRLAIEIARAAANHFQHGVVFVRLEPLTQNELLVSAIAQAAGLAFLGGEELETKLFNYFAEKSLLLILDNFEHLLSEVTCISTLLARAPGVKILATSREPLNLHEEWLYPLTGLAIPPSIYSTSLEDYEAVQLFLYHARRVQPGFDVISEQESIVRICRLTEGLPLAIELATSWLRGLSAAQIASEMQHNLDILSTRTRNVEERHRSIRVVFNQSWKLLSEDERQAIANLSLFRGSFDLEAAETIAGAGLSMLSSLVEKSLLRTSTNRRFDMHDLVRQYSEEQLDHLGHTTAIRAAHATYYGHFLAHLSGDLKSRRQREALNAITDDFQNVRAAWDWALQMRETQSLASACDSLFTFYELQSRLHEGDELLAIALEALPDESLLRCRLLARQASLKISLGQYELAQQLLHESVTLAESIGTSEQLAYSLNQLARAICYLGDYVEAERLCQQSYVLYETLADDWGRAQCLHVLGFILSRTGNIKSAREHYRRAVASFRALGDVHFLNASLINLGVMNSTLSEYVEARLNLEESLEIARQIGNRLEIARALDHLGMLLVWGFRDYDGAAAYYEQSLSLRHEIGDLPGIAHTLNNMGDVAVKVKDFTKAQQLYNQALTLFQRHNDPWNTALALAGVGDALTGLSQYDAALDYLQAALQKSFEIQAKVLTLSLFVSVVILFCKMEKRELATALTALIIHQPDSPPGLKNNVQEILADNLPSYNPPLDDLEQMGRLIYLQLDDMVQLLQLPRSYLIELTSVFPAGSPRSSGQIREALTQRELEILRLMATGLTNPQIADHLVIGVGTVKTHTLNIYRKLDVSNRTQAIIRAQELGL